LNNPENITLQVEKLKIARCRYWIQLADFAATEIQFAYFAATEIQFAFFAPTEIQLANLAATEIQLTYFAATEINRNPTMLHLQKKLLQTF
jgi:hypothetical protein